MANYTTNLKTWGDTGSVYPDGYNYLEGEQPVDAWDNYLQYNTIEDLDHLIDLTNARIESTKGSSYPSSPEDGEFCWRADLQEVHVYDAAASEWHDVLLADGDTMSGVLDMGGYQIENLGKLMFEQDAGVRTLADMSVSSGAAAGSEQSLNVSIDGTPLFKVSAESDGSGGTQNEQVLVHDAPLDTGWFRNYNGGSVGFDTFVPIGTFGLDSSETLKVTWATLTKNGFDAPCDSGVTLKIAVSNGDTVDVLAGDGLTIYDDETGSPLAEYTNSTGGHVNVAIGIDNGHFGTGVGDDTSAYAGFIVRKY